MKRKSFTLVEIMIVVAIIGLLAAIAIPSFLNARNTSRKNACINNLRQIDGAQQQDMLANGGTAPTLAGTQVYLKQSAGLACPASKTAYTLTDFPPKCPSVATYADHLLP
jgi:prepilin-type N-terminal cleavage/methylation domain-containing protein